MRENRMALTNAGSVLQLFGSGGGTNQTQTDSELLLRIQQRSASKFFIGYISLSKSSANIDDCNGALLLLFLSYFICTSFFLFSSSKPIELQLFLLFSWILFINLLRIFAKLRPSRYVPRFYRFEHVLSRLVALCVCNNIFSIYSVAVDDGRYDFRKRRRIKNDVILFSYRRMNVRSFFFVSLPHPRLGSLYRIKFAVLHTKIECCPLYKAWIMFIILLFMAYKCN